MRFLPIVALLAACGGSGARHSWYDSPLELQGAPYRDCTLEITQNGSLDADAEFNEKGSMTLWHTLVEGEVLAVASYTYDTDGTTLLGYDYGPNLQDFSTTATYEWDGDDLVRTVTFVEGDEDQGTRDVTYTTESTYGDDNKLSSTHTTSDAEPPGDVTTRWSWEDGDDGGAIATVTVDHVEGKQTLEFDADRWLVRDVTQAGEWASVTTYTYGEDHRVENIVVARDDEETLTAVEWDDDGRVKRVDVGEAQPQLYDWSCD